MNALLLLSALAFGDPPEPTYQRLFSPEATATTPAPALEAMPESAPMPASGWAWPALLSGVGLVAAWQLRKRAKDAAPAELRVVHRQSVGDKSTLMVVEVQDAHGATRRLLLGSAGNGINLLNDLGVVPAGAAPAAVAIPADDAVDEAGQDDGADASAPPRNLAFHDLLQEVLTERQPEPPPQIAELPRPRYFSLDDLAEHPSAEVAADEDETHDEPAPRGQRRRGTLRGRFTARTTTPAADAWTPTVETFAPAMDAVEAPVAEPRVQPVLRGAAALLARPATAAPAKAGLSLLVKGKLPADAPAATPTVAPPMMIEPPLAEREVPAATAPVAPAAVFIAPAAPVLEAPVVEAPVPVVEAPAPTRAVYVSPTMASAAPRSEKRLVGPPLRDPRLTAGAPASPRLRLADARPRPTAEEPMPPVGELIARLKEAQDAENAAPAMAANDQPRVARTDGIRRRFQAMSKEGAR